jgi:uncharacterized membrane protein
MKKLALVSLFLLAFLERTLFDFGPNIELVTTAMVLTAIYLGKQEAFWLTFLILALSDLILGNSQIFLFTWSGFLIPALIIGQLAKFRKKNGLVKILFGTGAGISANLFFYLWTNFGVWLLDSWGMYARDASGLIACFVNGLPFLKMQLISTLAFVPLVFTIYEFILQLKHDRLCWQYRKFKFSQL